MKVAAAPRPDWEGAGVDRPRRLQRSRRAGRVTTPGAVYIGRPTIWNNPFSSRRFGHVCAIQLHRRWLTGRASPRYLGLFGFGDAEIDALYRLRRKVLTAIGTLAGRDIECWCPLRSRWCHGDTLIAVANASEPGA